MADLTMRRAGYKKLPSKVGSNNGFDGVYAWDGVVFLISMALIVALGLAIMLIRKEVSYQDCTAKQH